MDERGCVDRSQGVSGEALRMVIGWRRCVFFAQDVGSVSGIFVFSKKLFSRNFCEF